MTSPREPLACPWCAHESPDSAAFRTHLMIDHRKSELARYVLDSQRAERDGTTAAQRRADPPADDPDEEPELIAR